MKTTLALLIAASALIHVGNADQLATNSHGTAIPKDEHLRQEITEAATDKPEQLERWGGRGWGGRGWGGRGWGGRGWGGRGWGGRGWGGRGWGGRGWGWGRPWGGWGYGGWDACGWGGPCW
ncbi:unnamed protein product [Aphanomyces euteiches]|uniref:Glycine-rich protein n=1 Tax=Aphanomyces euteiches TaxID=100861 RepID=A0A6G0WCP6_9STRA|nr:hypothetical protein Ae201684_017173 [Aphanomyces euteiches]KAF0724071.1 hypothetical protein Ae201684_017179 [Aphanomyces euteiches]KAH9078373.1 hypothetical protein Ae201684P_019463 [Aphanomyces euteiches]KAH9141709.1 hypothetical protein AeRB84_014141 [Aphanomyces euteiches]